MSTFGKIPLSDLPVPVGPLTRCRCRLVRLRAVLHHHGHVVYCPHCWEILNDQAGWEGSSAIRTPRCSMCGNRSKWEVLVGQVPVLLRKDL